jgi:hypothetical protein
LCYAPVGTRDRTCTCNTPGLGRRPLLIGIPWRIERSGRESNSPWAVDSRLASQMRTGPDQTFVPPAGFEPANAAFGGLRPFHLATACANRSLHQRQDSNLQLPCGGWLTATWLAIRLTLVRADVPSGPHRGASPDRRTPFRVPPGSRTLLAGLEDRVLAARTAVRMSSAPDLHRHVTRLQLAAYLFGPAERVTRGEPASFARRAPSREGLGTHRGFPSQSSRRRRESNARDCRRPRFSKPACYHSSTSPMSLMNGGTHGRTRTSRACVRSAGRDPVAVGVATAAGFEPSSPD